MPLLDHFHPPLSRSHPWRAFHGAWAAAIARLLNAGVLPSGYYAVPFLDRDGPIEIDVATLRQPQEANTSDEGTSPQAWSPPSPSLALAIEWPENDSVSVEIRTENGDPQLAAAIELVSPGNKDRAKAKAALASKCADYLRRGCGLVVVDVVTTRRANLQADLFAELGLEGSNPNANGLSAISYRSIGRAEEGQLLIWSADLEIAKPLPILPLWLGAEVSVPLDLEVSYQAACNDLLIR